MCQRKSIDIILHFYALYYGITKKMVICTYHSNIILLSKQVHTKYSQSHSEFRSRRKLSYLDFPNQASFQSRQLYTKIQFYFASLLLQFYCQVGNLVHCVWQRATTFCLQARFCLKASNTILNPAIHNMLNVDLGNQQSLLQRII